MAMLLDHGKILFYLNWVNLWPTVHLGKLPGERIWALGPHRSMLTFTFTVHWLRDLGKWLELL